MTLAKLKPEVNNEQVDVRKVIVMDYSLFITLPIDIQNNILKEMQSNIEFLKDWTYSIDEIKELILQEKGYFIVSRGILGSHDDVVLINWGYYLNHMYIPSEIGYEWLEQNGLSLSRVQN